MAKLTLNDIIQSLMSNYIFLCPLCFKLFIDRYFKIKFIINVNKPVEKLQNPIH